MNLVLDIAAGILLAYGIRAFVVHWFDLAAEDARGGEENRVARTLGIIGVLIGAGLVISRLFR